MKLLKEIDDKKRRIIRDYNETAEIYNSRYRNIQKEKYDQTMAEMWETTNPNPIILDIGTGTGLFLEVLKEDLNQSSPNTICGDISLKMLKIAQTNHPESMFILFDAENLPIKQNSIDIITCFSVLQNLSEPKKTIKEMERVLKNNGMGIITALEKKVKERDILSYLKDTNLQIDKLIKLRKEDIAVKVTKSP